MGQVLPPLFRPGAGPEGAMLDPSDPVARWSDCHFGDDEESSFPVTVRTLNSLPRAAIQRNAADWLGCDFQDLSVLARWGRIFTRMQCWHDYGQEEWFDLWLHRNKVGYYFQPGAYYYDADAPKADRDGWGSVQRVLPPDPPAVPPAEWCPNADKPVWELCKPSDSGATPIYIVTELS